MATVDQAIRLNMSFVGTIDPSWSRSVQSMRDRLKGLGKELSRLARQQQKLTLSASGGIAELSEQYKGLSTQIRRTTNQQKQLNVEIKKAQINEHWSSGGTSGGKSAFLPALSTIGNAFVGAVTTLYDTNKKTAEEAADARAYGVSIETFKSWQGMGQQAGLNGNDIGDMLATFRAHGLKSQAVKGALPALGLKTEDLKSKSSDRQAGEIIDRLSHMKDEKHAAGIANTLFGGEANKLLTYMRMSGQSYQELIDEQARYNMVTQQGADSAFEGNRAFTNLWAVFTTGAQEITSALSAELAPKVRALTEDLASWFKGGGIEKLKSFMTRTIYPALVAVMNGAVLVGKVLFALAEKLDWVLPDKKKENNNKQMLLTQVAAGNSSLETVGYMSESLGLRDWFDTAINNPDTVSQLRAQWLESKSAPGGTAAPAEQQKLMDIVQPYGTDGLLDVNALKKLLDSPRASTPELRKELEGTANVAGKGPVQINQTNNTTIEVHQLPGQSQEALAQSIADAQNPGFSSMQNILGDLPAGWGG